MNVKPLFVGIVIGAAAASGAWYGLGSQGGHEMHAGDTASHATMPGHAAHSTVPAEHADNPAVRAYIQANDVMHAGMNIPFTGDADIDFAAGMIPHHEGAVEMARIVLEHGKDPEIRKIAQEIMAAQEAEISFFQDWLKRQGR